MFDDITRGEQFSLLHLVEFFGLLDILEMELELTRVETKYLLCKIRQMKKHLDQWGKIAGYTRTIMISKK